MSPTLRTILVILAAACAAFAAIDPVGVPEWVQAVVAALSAGLAGAGIVPPSLGDDVTHAVTVRSNYSEQTPVPNSKVYARSSYGTG